MNSNSGLNILLNNLIRNHIKLEEQGTRIIIENMLNEAIQVDFSHYTDNWNFRMVDKDLIIEKSTNKYIKLKKGTIVKLELVMIV